MIGIPFEEPSSAEWKAWRAANEDVAAATIKEIADGKKPKIDRAIMDKFERFFEWEVWKLEGVRARDKAIADFAAGRKPTVDEKLYKREKHVFMAAANNKCAYCETKIGGVDQPGDVEHFRPKGRIIDESGKPVTIKDDKGNDIPHPGYYWLAYDWRNLLIACKTCNSPMRDEEAGITRGKWDRFPLMPGTAFRATKPGDEAKEIAAFLHPVFEDPEKHFAFDEKTGLLGCKTQQAEICEKWLYLNREGLRELRVDTYESVMGRTTKLFNAVTLRVKDTLQETVNFLTAYKKGEKAYSLVGRKAIRDSESQLKEMLSLMSGSSTR